MKRFKLTKLIVSSLIVGLVVALNPIGVSAEWKQDSTGWWYTEANGYSKGWKEIDGKWYYFYNNGYMAKNAIVDGYALGKDGAWLKESQKISVVYPSNWRKVTLNDGTVGYYLDNKATNVSLRVDSMYGISEEVYLKYAVSCLKSEFSNDNVDVQEQIFNNNKAHILHYYMKHNNLNLSVYQAIFFHNNTVYAFTFDGVDPISDESMTSFKNMLNTVSFTG